MKLQKWTTDFKHGIETIMAPVWINLPNLWWHFFEWAALCRIAEPIGIPIICDKATLSKIRLTTAKIKVETDITKPLVKEVLIDIVNKEGQKETRIQKVEYETIPEYCGHCKMQGHSDINYGILHPELRQSSAKYGNQVNKTSILENKSMEATKGKVNNKIEIDKGSSYSGDNKEHGLATMEVENMDKEEGWTTVTNNKGKKKAKSDSNNLQGKNISIANLNTIKEAMKDTIESNMFVSGENNATKELTSVNEQLKITSLREQNQGNEGRHMIQPENIRKIKRLRKTSLLEKCSYTLYEEQASTRSNN
ncbi:uncharacterized protein [Nicotiana sylvestris]|uniref:uncharacterized protein n=1 Tax=Nicotiana sylvestris TaxID=4096 RepID=UPI00388CD847